MGDDFLVFVLNEETNKDFDSLLDNLPSDGLRIVKGWKETDNLALNILKMHNLEPDCIIFDYRFFIEHPDVFKETRKTRYLKIVPMVIVGDVNDIDSQWLKKGIDDIITLPVQKSLFFQRLKILCEVGYYRKNYDKNFASHFFEDK